MNSVARFSVFGWLLVTASAEWMECGTLLDPPVGIQCFKYAPREEKGGTVYAFSSGDKETSSELDSFTELAGMSEKSGFVVVVVYSLASVKPCDGEYFFEKLVPQSAKTSLPILLMGALHDSKTIMAKKCINLAFQGQLSNGEVVTPYESAHGIGGTTIIDLAGTFPVNDVFVVPYYFGKEASCTYEPDGIVRMQKPYDVVPETTLIKPDESSTYCSDAVRFMYANKTEMGYTRLVGSAQQNLIGFEFAQPCGKRRLGASDEIVDPRGVDSDDEQEVMRPKSLGGANKASKGEALLI